MLIGQYEGKIGEKKQISFPKKFREVLGDRLVITKGLEECLIVVSEEGWKTLLEGTEGKPFIDKASREMQRFLLGNAIMVDVDSKGRFVLPEHLAHYAHITVDVVFAGIQRFVEMWNKKDWEEQQKRLSENIGYVADKLSGVVNS